jgi:hypothetical protein
MIEISQSNSENSTIGVTVKDCQATDLLYDSAGQNLLRCAKLTISDSSARAIMILLDAPHTPLALHFKSNR